VKKVKGHDPAIMPGRTDRLVVIGSSHRRQPSEPTPGQIKAVEQRQRPRIYSGAARTLDLP
jgi:hypothetical protein